MIDFDRYLKREKRLNEDNVFQKLKQMAIQGWLSNCKQKHKDSKKNANDAPEGIKNARDKSSLLDAISSWKDNASAILKNAYSNIIKTSKKEPTDDSSDDTETKDKETKETKETKDTKETKEITSNDVDGASYKDLNNSKFVANYDLKSATDIAELETKENELKKILRDTEKQQMQKRAENFKNVMQNLSDVIKTLFPEVSTDVLDKMGDNAIEGAQKRAEEKAKIDSFEDSVKSNFKELDNQHKETLEKLENIKNTELEKLKYDLGPYANSIQSKCKLEMKQLEHSKEMLQSVISERDKIEKQLKQYENRGNEKEMIKKLREQLNNYNEQVETHKKIVAEDQKKYAEKIDLESKDFKKDITKYRNEQKKKIEKNHAIAYESMEIELKKKKNDITNAKNDLIFMMQKVSKDYPDQRDIPSGLKIQIKELQDNFIKAVGDKGTRIIADQNNDDRGRR